MYRRQQAVAAYVQEVAGISSTPKADAAHLQTQVVVHWLCDGDCELTQQAADPVVHQVAAQVLVQPPGAAAEGRGEG